MPKRKSISDAVREICTASSTACNESPRKLFPFEHGEQEASARQLKKRGDSPQCNR